MGSSVGPAANAICRAMETRPNSGPLASWPLRTLELVGDSACCMTSLPLSLGSETRCSGAVCWDPLRRGPSIHPKTAACLAVDVISPSSPLDSAARLSCDRRRDEQQLPSGGASICTLEEHGHERQRQPQVAALSGEQHRHLPQRYQTISIAARHLHLLHQRRRLRLPLSAHPSPPRRARPRPAGLTRDCHGPLRRVLQGLRILLRRCVVVDRCAAPHD